MSHTLPRLTATLLVTVLTITAVLTAHSPAHAQETQVHRFVGAAMVNGMIAPQGTPVQALAGATVLDSTTVSITALYILAVPQPPATTLITFTVNGATATQTADWQAQALSNLDLTTGAAAALPQPLQPLNVNGATAAGPPPDKGM